MQGSAGGLETWNGYRLKKRRVACLISTLSTLHQPMVRASQMDGMGSAAAADDKDVKSQRYKSDRGKASSPSWVKLTYEARSQTLARTISTRNGGW